MWLLLLVELIFLSPIHADDQSFFTFSSSGLEFSPKRNIQLLAFDVKSNVKECSLACHRILSCRTFDYDSISQRCRLFEADSTTGSTIISSSLTSIVGTVKIDASLYTSIYNHPCSMCRENRYQICSTTSNMCDCPPHTYWTGNICALQLFENDTCTQVDACRSDLNLSCPLTCYGEFDRCIRSLTNYTALFNSPGYGVTVAGGCNGTSSTTKTKLSAPADVMILPNGTMLVTNNDGRLLSFLPGNRTGQTLSNFSDWGGFMYYDVRTDSIYVTVYNENLVHILPSETVIPPNGVTTAGCALNRTYRAIGLVGDNSGNIYITSNLCHWVLKWAPNATVGTIVAGSSNGNSGSSSNALDHPYSLALDEQNSYLYVSDRFNHRIQRFNLSSGSRNGTTVAGTGTNGSAADQLNLPTEIYLSKIDRSLYIVDNGNNRIQKWLPNATMGVTIAGSSTGVAGSTPYLLDYPFGLALDENETWLYVSDMQNKRIQRFKVIR